MNYVLSLVLLLAGLTAQAQTIDENANSLPIIQIREDPSVPRLFLTPSERLRIRSHSDSLKLLGNQLSDKASLQALGATNTSVNALKTKTDKIDTLAGKGLLNLKVGQTNDAINNLQNSTNLSIQGLNTAIGERVRKIDADTYYKKSDYVPTWDEILFKPALTNGKDGVTPVISIGSVATVTAGQSATVTQGGSTTAPVFNFVVPIGKDGLPGQAGQAATLQIRNVYTVANGTPASVTNVGSSTAAVYDVFIPEGKQGAPGSATGTVTQVNGKAPANGSISLSADDVPSGGVNKYSTPEVIRATTDGLYSTLGQLTSTNSRVATKADSINAYRAIAQKLAISDTATLVRKVPGKVLSSNDFTGALLNKLAGIASGATNVTNTAQLTNGAGYQTDQQVAQAIQNGIAAKPTALANLAALRASTAADVYQVDGLTYKLDVSDNTSPDDFGTVIIRNNGQRLKLQYDGMVPLSIFKNDGANDATAILRAMRSNASIITTPANTTLSVPGLLTIQYAKRKTLRFGGPVLSADKTQGMLLIQHSSDIRIEGGEFGNTQAVTANGGNTQHAIQIDNSDRVVIDGIHITSSPEMGVAITNSYDVTVQNSVIENTFRDGTYSHGSARIRYLNNHYRNIGDDAMSNHYYGDTTEIRNIRSKGYKAATDFIAFGNTVENAKQGFVSVQGSNGAVAFNIFKNIAWSGIAIWNREDLYPGGVSRANHWIVTNNQIDSVGYGARVNGSFTPNTAQSTAGRAAIFAGATDGNNIRTLTPTKRLSNITITYNKVYNSGALSLNATTVDTLALGGNEFNNPTTTGTTLAGDACEIFEVTSYNETANNLVRGSMPRGYRFSGVSGKIGLWQVIGNSGAVPGIIVNSPNLGYIYQRPLAAGTNISFSAEGNLPTDPVTINATGGSSGGSTDLSKVVQGTSAKRATFTGDFNGVRPAGFENIQTASLGGVVDNSQQFLGINVPHENATGDGGPWLWRLFRPITSKFFYFQNYFGQAGSFGKLGWNGADRIHTQSWLPVDTLSVPSAGKALVHNGSVYTPTALGAAAYLDVPSSGTASATQIPRGNDPRFSDARTPTTHAHSAGDITSGIMAPARLGSGTPATGKYLDGLGVWTTLPTGGGGSSSSYAATGDELNGFLLGTDRLIDVRETGGMGRNQGYFHQVIATQSAQVGGMAFKITRGGSVSGSTYQNAVGLFDASGNLLAIGDARSVLGSSGWKKVMFDAPYTLVAGQRYVLGIVANGDDIPGFAAAQSFGEYNQFAPTSLLRNFRKGNVTTLNQTMNFTVDISANTDARIFLALTPP